MKLRKPFVNCVSDYNLTTCAAAVWMAEIVIKIIQLLYLSTACCNSLRLSLRKMSAFIVPFRRSFKVKFLLGMCPFETDIIKRRVYLSSRSAIYTIVYTLLHLMVYLILSFQHLPDFDQNNTTRTIAKMLVEMTPGTALICMLAISIKNRRRHVNLINAVDMILSRLHATAKCKPVNIPSKLILRNICVAVCFSGCPILDLIVYNAKRSFWAKAYYILFAVAITNMLVALLHAQDIAIVLINAIECLINGDISTDTNVQALSDLCNMTYSYQKCFGTQFLISTLIDLLILTVTWFFLLVQIAFVQGDRLVEECFCVVVYIVQILVKNVLVIGVIDRLESLVEDVNMTLVTKINAQSRSDASDSKVQLCVCNTNYTGEFVIKQ